MRILRYALPRALGILAAAWLAVFMSAGCGGSGASSSDVTKEMTPASLSVGRDASGNVLIAFLDENNDPVAVNPSLFEAQVSMEPSAMVAKMAMKADEAESVLYVWNRYYTRVKLVPKGINPCVAFVLEIGDGVIPAECEVEDEELCKPLDVAGSYEFPAVKSPGDLIALDGEEGCYDDFVVATQEEIPVELLLDDEIGQAKAYIDALAAEVAACAELSAEASTLVVRIDSVVSRYESLGGTPDAMGVEVVWDPACAMCVADPVCWEGHVAVFNGQLDALELEMSELESEAGYMTTTISVYAGNPSPSESWEPSASMTHTGDKSIPYIARPLVVLGNVTGGDSPKVALGGPAGDSGANFLAIPVVDDVLPEFAPDPVAMEIDTHAVLMGRFNSVYDAGDLDGDGLSDILFRSSEFVSVVRGQGFSAGVAELDDYVALQVALPTKAYALAAGADINSTPLDSVSYDDVAIGFPMGSYGMVAVNFGGAVLDGDEDMVVTGEQKNDEFGRAIALGDVDGDGYADMLVGAPMYGSEVTMAGAVYVLRGGEVLPKSLGAVSAWSKIYGDEEPTEEVDGFGVLTLVGKRFGSGLAFLGDVDHDGMGDFSATTEEATYVFLGSSSLSGSHGSSAKASLIIEASEGRIWNAIPLGDIDGDGAMDFAIRYAYSDTESAVCIFLGGSHFEEKMASAEGGSVDIISADIIFPDFGGTYLIGPVARLRK